MSIIQEAEKILMQEDTRYEEKRKAEIEYRKRKGRRTLLNFLNTMPPDFQTHLEEDAVEIELKVHEGLTVPLREPELVLEFKRKGALVCDIELSEDGTWRRTGVKERLSHWSFSDLALYILENWERNVNE